MKPLESDGIAMLTRLVIPAARMNDERQLTASHLARPMKLRRQWSSTVL